jgi:hypothetical protein
MLVQLLRIVELVPRQPQPLHVQLVKLILIVIGHQNWDVIMIMFAVLITSVVLVRPDYKNYFELY